MFQASFFDLDNRFKKLDPCDPLDKLKKIIDWDSFREPLGKIAREDRKSNAGRKPFDAILMFKGLIIQHLYNLSDAQLEFQIRDRFTFLRFLDLTPESRVPDANTFWDFREHLIQADLIRPLFDAFDAYLNDQGIIAEKGQIIDASFVEVPKQRNTREENAQIKEGKTPESFEENPNKKRQKDVDAKWASKNGDTHYGYKNHVGVDVENKIIRDYEVTSAEVHDSQVLLQVLTDNTSAKVYADSAYKSEANDVLLEASGYKNRIHERAYRNKPLTEKQKVSNKKKSIIRARVEHVFASITNEQDGMHVRVIGMHRAAAKIGLTNLVYNIRRFVSLTRVATSSI